MGGDSFLPVGVSPSRTAVVKSSKEKLTMPVSLSGVRLGPYIFYPLGSFNLMPPCK